MTIKIKTQLYFDISAHLLEFFYCFNMFQSHAVYSYIFYVGKICTGEFNNFRSALLNYVPLSLSVNVHNIYLWSAYQFNIVLNKHGARRRRARQTKLNSLCRSRVFAPTSSLLVQMTT